MEEIHKRVLAETLIYLKEKIKPQCVLDYLFVKDILKADEMERLKKKKSIAAAVDQLVRVVLPRSGPDAFSCFLEALNDTKQSFASEHLLDKEKQIRQKIIEGKEFNTLLCPCP